MSRKKENIDFITNAVHATETFCPYLQFWTSPQAANDTASNSAPKSLGSFPSKSQQPVSHHPSMGFYYGQVDALTELFAGKKWDFVLNHNVMNIADPLDICLALWKELCKSEKVPFPGTREVIAMCIQTEVRISLRDSRSLHLCIRNRLRGRASILQMWIILSLGAWCGQASQCISGSRVWSRCRADKKRWVSTG